MTEASEAHAATRSAASRAARGFALGAAAWPSARWEALPRAELLELHRALSAVRRQVDAALAAASAEVARRSQVEHGAAGLSRREGYASPARLVAASTGGTTAEAARLIAVGQATLAACDAPSATPGAPPHLAKAVNAGRISIDAASAIAAMLTRVAGRAPIDAIERAEELLVGRALSLPFDRLVSLIRHVEARLDPAAHLEREHERYESRYLHVLEGRGGMVVVDGRLDPETAAPLRAALDGMVADALRRRRDDSGPLADTRTAPQMRADALRDLARHALGCEARDLPLATTTVVVRVSLDDLRAGLGLGDVDGTEEPLSVGAVRRMAADAEVIPAVLGGDDEVLNFGRSRRLFTRAQRLALVERDGGCAYCHAPPSWTEVHHVRWWGRDAGPTDLDNGVLLCTSCHHRIHRDGWDISVRDGTVWFVPPASVDRDRRPILGGRERFSITARDAASLEAPPYGLAA